MSTIHELYEAAIQADASYSATIERVFPGQTRWTLTREQDENREVSIAYTLKINADRAYQRATESARNAK